ncbi:hypothetical protein [Paractinoplanes brasiliensis]|uniref:hypothetical protein n=1 Tax=Paractinoplanes brasiliensis TaxID=52695 RepID=UPI0010611F48|nr:hypothetical protein [Actinoplanes brasiliensis]GID33287.1 hypothetical protein Abr02nite_82700 [Actinoplanes brasiliensis]
MTEASTWRDVKAKACALDPDWDSSGRVARRQQMREQMFAAIRGSQLAEAAGLSQPRVRGVPTDD